MWQQRPTLSRTSRPSLGHGSVARKERVKIALSVECLFLGLEYLVEGGRGETEGARIGEGGRARIWQSNGQGLKLGAQHTLGGVLTLETGAELPLVVNW